MFPNCSLGLGLGSGVAWPESRFYGVGAGRPKNRAEPAGKVVLVTQIGRARAVYMLVGDPLPRTR